MKKGLDLHGLLLVCENGMLQQLEATIKEIDRHGQRWGYILF